MTCTCQERSQLFKVCIEIEVPLICVHAVHITDNRGFQGYAINLEIINRLFSGYICCMKSRCKMFRNCFKYLLLKLSAHYCNYEKIGKAHSPHSQCVFINFKG